MSTFAPARSSTTITAAIALTITLTACGSGGGSQAAGTTTQSAPAGLAQRTYDGPEAQLPQGYSKPSPKSGFAFTIGFPNPSRGVPALKAEEDGARQATEALGGKFVALDAGFSVQKQVSDFQQLLDQKVSAIVLSALDPNSLAPLLKKAAAQGVPVIVNDLPYKAGDPAVPGFATTVTSGTDQGSFAKAKAVALADPGAKFGIVGLAIPSPFLSYIADSTKAWAEKLGLHYAGRLDAKLDTPDAGLQTGGELLAKYPDLNVVFTVSDSLALGTSSAARQAGRSKVKIVGNGGYSAVVAAIKNGTIFATYGTDNTEIGRQWVYSAYDTLTKQNLPLPTQVVVPGNKLLTKDDLSGFTPIG